MAEDLMFYESRTGDDELGLPIDFDPVVAGEEEVRSVFVENTSSGKASFDDVTCMEDQVIVEGFVDNLDPGDRAELILRFEPNLGDREPVDAELVFDYSLIYM